MTIPRSEHPRPDFYRENWLCLNGLWDFSIGAPTYDRQILVPFSPESRLSGVEDKRIENREFWYRRSFRVPPSMRGKRLRLHFGAVDYAARVYLNGSLAAEHEGGQTAFETDITDLTDADGENRVEVCAIDDPADFDLPRGKQYWKPDSESIFYTRNSGIWQTVWLEAVDACRLERVEILPDLDRHCVSFRYRLSQPASLRIAVSFAKDEVAVQTVEGNMVGECGISLDRCVPNAWNVAEELTWSPEMPRLFDVVFTVLREGVETDTVRSYFGLRKVHIQGGRFYLNNRPCFQKLILDQGYWPDGLLTAPSDEAFVQDILHIKEMGFNGVRLHQKIEDPRFLYHADRLGLLVWGECAAAYRFSDTAMLRTTRQWMENLMQNRNHPCIVTWTPLNESWGVPDIGVDPAQQAFSKALCELTRAMDTTRPVIDNDGWEHVGGDLLTIHDYTCEEMQLRASYASLDTVLKSRPGGRALLASGAAYGGAPVMVTEFGGIAFGSLQERDWGYSVAKDEKDLLCRLDAVFLPMLESPVVAGYCYTQFTDVEQEMNGLMTYDRQPKLPLECIATLQKWPRETEQLQK